MINGILLPGKKKIDTQIVWEVLHLHTTNTSVNEECTLKEESPQKPLFVFSILEDTMGDKRVITE